MDMASPPEMHIAATLFPRSQYRVHGIMHTEPCARSGNGTRVKETTAWGPIPVPRMARGARPGLFLVAAPQAGVVRMRASSPCT